MVDERTFADKKPGEKVLYVLHRHWFTFLQQLLLVLVLGALPIIGWWLWQSYAEWELASDSLGYALLIMGGSVYALFLWNLLYHFWLDFSLDYYVISNQRLIDVEQSGLFHRTIAEQHIDRIQDCTSESKGFFATMLRYGNVYIQTAGEKERFVFENVPNPEAVVRTIFENAEIRTPDKHPHQPEPSAPVTGA